MDLWEQMNQLRKNFDAFNLDLEEVKRVIRSDRANNLDRADSWIDLQGSPIRSEYQWFIKQLRDFIHNERNLLFMSGDATQKEKMEESQRRSEANSPLVK